MPSTIQWYVALEKLEKAVVANLRQALRNAGTVLFDKIKLNAGLTDHSLKDLADLGHPYAKRAPKKIHDPDYQVHIQTGLLESNIGQRQETPDRVVVGVNGEAVPYLDDVIYGTPLMVARPFVTGSFEEVKPKIVGEFETAVKKSIAES